LIARLLRGLPPRRSRPSSPIRAQARWLARTRGARADAGHRARLAAPRGLTSGGVELFDLAAAGPHRRILPRRRPDRRQANINLVGTGEYPNNEVRWPGSFGSAYCTFWCRA